jgi:membrane-associated phospholipid phosphatase
MAEEAVPETPRADRRFGVRAILAFVAVFLAAVPFAVLVVLVVGKSPGLAHVDQRTATTLHTYALDHPNFTTAMKGVGRAFSPLGWWIILTPLFVWLLIRRLPRLATFVAVTAIGSSLLNTLIKTVVHRARPHLIDPVAVAVGKSFPSGHAQGATVGFGMLVLVFLPIVPRRGRAWLWTGAAGAVALIGFSRIALGVHYLSDVVGGFVIGAAWLLAMTAAFSAWRQERRRPAVHIGEGLEPEQRDRLVPHPRGDGDMP